MILVSRNILTQWSVVLKKLIVAQMVRKSPPPPPPPRGMREVTYLLRRASQEPFRAGLSKD